MKSSISVLFLALLLSACGDMRADQFPIRYNTPCADTIELIGAHAVRFCGETDRASIEQLIATLEEAEAEELVITSIGGDTSSAMQLGRYIREQDIDLYVDALCLSSCSQIVAMSANNLYLGADAMFGMHDTQSSTNILVRNIGVRPGMLEHATAEEEYYTYMGVPLYLLYEPTVQIGVRCIVNGDDYLELGALNVKSAYKYYMPSEVEFLRFFPGNLRSVWPSEKSVSHRIVRLRDKFSMPIVYGRRFGDADGEVLPKNECAS